MVKALAKMPKAKGRRYEGIRLTINGAIKLHASSTERSASVTVPVRETTHRGADLVIGFNCSYLLEALAARRSETFTAHFTDALAPVRLDCGPDHVAVVMPMRL